MKQAFESVRIDGVRHPYHEIEVLCSHCQDPVSDEEKATGTCTNCGEPWEPLQNVSIWVTSLPASGAKTWGQ